MRFWHDFVHERVLAGGFTWLTNVLAWRIDIPLVDGFFTGLATSRSISASRIAGNRDD